MNILSRTIALLEFIFLASAANAQIGYQVSLLNNATGEPRANESVTVTVKITDSEGTVICEQTKQETTNDFGILSMSVGTVTPLPTQIGRSFPSLLRPQPTTGSSDAHNSSPSQLQSTQNIPVSLQKKSSAVKPGKQRPVMVLAPTPFFQITPLKHIMVTQVMTV